MTKFNFSLNNSDLESLNLPLPTFAGRSEIKLPPDLKVKYLLLAEFDIKGEENLSRKFELYCARYPLAGALEDGKHRALDDDGFFVVFYIKEKLNQELLEIWTLSQTMSVVFSDIPEASDFKVLWKRDQSLCEISNAEPNWKWSEATWPLIESKPMKFFADFDLLDTLENRNFATTNERIFLFYSSINESIRFKIVTQRVRFQSAEDHYSSEIKRKVKKK